MRFGEPAESRRDGEPGAVARYDGWTVSSVSAAAAVMAWVERMTPAPYSRSVLAIALLRAADRLVNGSDPIRGRAREKIGNEALQLWVSTVPRARAPFASINIEMITKHDAGSDDIPAAE